MKRYFNLLFKNCSKLNDKYNDLIMKLLNEDPFFKLCFNEIYIL